MHCPVGGRDGCPEERHEQKGCPLRGDKEKFDITRAAREGLMRVEKSCQDGMVMESFKEIWYGNEIVW